MINFASNLNKMIDAGLGGPLDPPRTEVAVGHRVVYTEASGAVVNFETNVIAPVKNLRVTMEPVQDLHGQDAPYPAGGGKNLFDPSAATVGVNWNGSALAYSIASDYIPVVVGETYTQSVSDMPKFTGVVVAFLDADKVYKTNTANMTFTVPADTAFVRISFRCASDQSWTDADLSAAKIQFELGSSATAYAPYSNICPITGRDVVTVYRSGADMSSPQSVTIQLGQTVYGGTLDVATGKLTVTEKYSLLNNPDKWISYSGSVAAYQYTERYPDRKFGSRRVMKSSAFPIFDANIPLSIGWLNSSNSPFIGIVDTNNVLSLSDLKTLAESGSIQIVYELEEPVEINITPEQITTLIGDNNVWSDAGNISLEYPYYEETEGY